MAYVIAEPRIGTKNTTRVEACPVDCIHLNVLGSLGTPAAAMARPPQKVPMRRHLRPCWRWEFLSASPTTQLAADAAP